MDDSEMRSLLEYDGLAAAEALSGTSYKEDPITMLAGFGLNVRNSELKRQALTAAGDTHYSSDFVEQLDAFLDLGFEVVASYKFRGSDMFEEPVMETFLILWHPDGVLGTMESYEGTRRNTAKFYYNWRPNEPDGNWFKFTSSGGPFVDGVYPGYHDGREALKFNFEQLKANGEFVSPWVASPFLWLLNYMDTKVEGYDYKEINNARFADLPEHVRTAIGVNQ